MHFLQTHIYLCLSLTLTLTHKHMCVCARKHALALIENDATNKWVILGGGRQFFILRMENVHKNCPKKHYWLGTEKVILQTFCLCAP